MKKYFLSIILVVSTINLLQSQIKIGTNPQNIDGASVLELESNNRVLVITRVSDAQMNAITPLQGALIYNTDEECVFYYNGTTWENLCTELNTFNVDFSIVGEDLVLTDSNGDTVSVPLSDLGVSVFTSNPIFNPVDNDNTIVITENADNVNIEVGEITGFNIVDSSINGFLDIQTGSIVNSNLQDDAVDRTKIDANIAGIGLVQAPDGSLEVDVTGFSGTGTLSSPTNTLEITGNPVNSIFNSIGLDVADDAITQAKIADNAVGTNEIINGAVTTDKILDTNVTASKIAADVAGTGLTQAGNGALQVDVTAFTGDGAISSPDNSITLTGTPATATLEDVTVEVNVDGTTLEVVPAGVQIADDGVTTDKILDANVTNAKLDKANIPLSGFGAAAADVDIGNNRLTNVTDPTAAQDAATRNYVDTQIVATADDDITDVTFDGTNLTVEEGATNFSADLSALEESADITANAVALAAHVTADTDTDETNELSDITITGTTISLTNPAAGAVGVDLDATFATNAQLTAATDDDITDVTFDGTNLTVEEGATNFSANLSALEESAEITANATALAAHIAGDTDTDETNELSDLQITGTTISLTNAAAGATGVDLDAAFATNAQLTAAADDDITDVTFDGTNLTVEEGATNFSADLSALEESVDIAANSTALAAHIAGDTDTDETNELSDLQITGTTISLTNAAAGATGVDLDATFATNAQLTAATSGGGGNNLATDNLVQDAEDRTYDLNGNDIQFTGSGSFGIGSFGSAGAPASIEAKLDVDGVIRARDRFRTSSGSATLPGYGFFTNTDNNMGMFRVGIDILGFSTNGIEAIRIDNNQNVGIGVTNPLANLHVNGDVRADGGFFSSDQTIDVPDYVFQKYFNDYSEINNSYKFKSLDEIEIFIKKKNHLPGIKSAQEIKNQGYWDLTEASKKNLEKIEELFLHTIEQEKKIDQLKSENEILAKELDTLKKDLAEIKGLLKKQ